MSNPAPVFTLYLQTHFETMHRKCLKNTSKTATKNNERWYYFSSSLPKSTCTSKQTSLRQLRVHLWAASVPGRLFSSGDDCPKFSATARADCETIDCWLSRIGSYWDRCAHRSSSRCPQTWIRQTLRMFWLGVLSAFLRHQELRTP